MAITKGELKTLIIEQIEIALKEEQTELSAQKIKKLGKHLSQDLEYRLRDIGSGYVVKIRMFDSGESFAIDIINRLSKSTEFTVNVDFYDDQVSCRIFDYRQGRTSLVNEAEFSIYDRSLFADLVDEIEPTIMNEL